MFNGKAFLPLQYWNLNAADICGAFVGESLWLYEAYGSLLLSDHFANSFSAAKDKPGTYLGFSSDFLFSPSFSRKS